MEKTEFNPETLKNLFKELGLNNPGGDAYKERVHKYPQVSAYIIQIESALTKLSKKIPPVFLDCGCGKSYLSFIVYDYCYRVLDRKIKIIGVDNNADLIEKCAKTAEELGFENMEFHHATVEEFKPESKIDAVYSLHACNTATDQTIAKAISVGARYIFSVSCCQHRNRKSLAGHPLTSISRHKDYKERLTDMIGDSMRALLLENEGYGISIFEFVAAKYTPKNIMLRGIKNTVKRVDREQALERYEELANMFNIRPALEDYLKEFPKMEF